MRSDFRKTWFIHCFFLCDLYESSHLFYDRHIFLQQILYSLVVASVTPTAASVSPCSESSPTVLYRLNVFSSRICVTRPPPPVCLLDHFALRLCDVTPFTFYFCHSTRHSDDTLPAAEFMFCNRLAAPRFRRIKRAPPHERAASRVR